MIDIFTLAARFDRTVDFSMCRSQFACSTWSQLQGQTELQSVVQVTRTPVSYLTDIRAPFWSECCRFTVHAPLNLQPCRTNAILCQQATIQERPTGSKAESTTLPQRRGSTYSWVLIEARASATDFSVLLPILTSISRGSLSRFYVCMV